MNSGRKFWIIVPAAGTGTRVGAELPKQYLPLAGASLIEHTLKVLLQIDSLEKIILALHPQDRYWSELPLSSNDRIITVEGGAQRFHSVLNALYYIEPLAQPDDWVLVHDAARPCITASHIEKLMSVVQDHEVGGILATPVSDTLKSVSALNSIERTVEREGLWQAQTPQMFRFGLLLQALSAAVVSGITVTDEAAALEMAGYQAMVVEGRRDNIKVTHSEDLQLAEMILQSGAISESRAVSESKAISQSKDLSGSKTHGKKRS